MKILSKIFAFFCIVILMSCGNGKSASGLPLDDRGREDFGAFIDKFYNDINFQLSRVEFPVLTKAGEDGRPGFIEEENWRVMKAINSANADYEVQLIEIAEDFMEQRILVKKAFIIVLKFNLNIDDQWYLTYYSGFGGQAFVGDDNEKPNASTDSKINRDSTGTIQIQIDSTAQ
jgi:hypothetical protein